MILRPQDEGMAATDLQVVAHKQWMMATVAKGIDLTGFNEEASFEERINWALNNGLEVGCVLSRFSTKLQQSTEAQVQACVEYAAFHGIYVPPELICVDEGSSGRKQRRDGLDRATQILELKLARTLLVYKVSRLMRVGYKGFQFVNENVVEEGLRAISVSQGIDTNDRKTWKSLMYLHGMMDDLLLDTIADHCREGLKGLFSQGFVTGVLPVGYFPEPVPGASLTNLGKPRCKPSVDEDAGELIRIHFRYIRDGVPIAEGHRRWVEAGGPCSANSTLGYMSYPAYRRLLSNQRYTGLWAFCRTRSEWSNKRDYAQKFLQPETEVKIYQSEELRIVSYEDFHAVQVVLAKHKQGPRGPRKDKPVRLWDLTTGMFFCAACSTEEDMVRFYQGGAAGGSMKCKLGKLCKALSVVRREQAIRNVCEELARLIQRDAELVEDLILASQAHAAIEPESIAADIERAESAVANLTRRISAMYDQVGLGSEFDQKEAKAKLAETRTKRSEAQAELGRLIKVRDDELEHVTVDQIREAISELPAVLAEAAGGSTDPDIVYRALAVFRAITGGEIMVHVEPRPGRKQTNVRATFRPRVVKAIAEVIGRPVAEPESEEVSVWLREPPMRDRLAPRVHELMDIEGHSYRSAAAVFQKEGHEVNSGVVWQIYRRYYEMIGEDPPEREYNNGRPRRSA